MKNTTFRKKALLSSVAMLLVALVALGSATFAWFAANPNATASGLDLKTTASQGLVIKTDTDATWSHDAKLYKDINTIFDLTPVSQDQATPANFWTVDAAASDKSAAGANAMTPASVGDYDTPGAVYSEKVYFRLSDGSAKFKAEDNMDVFLKNITITKATDATMENCIRVAITNKSGALLGTWAISTAGSGYAILDEEGQDTGDKAPEVITTAAKTPSSFNPPLAVHGTTSTAVCAGEDLTADGKDEDNFVTVYVYLDGQDYGCYSDAVGTVNAAQIIDGIQLDFVLKAAA